MLALWGCCAWLTVCPGVAPRCRAHSAHCLWRDAYLLPGYAPVNWRFVMVGHGRGCLEGATALPKKSVEEYRSPGAKVRGNMVNFWPFFAHIPPQFSAAPISPRCFPAKYPHPATCYHSCCSAWDPPTSGRRPNLSRSSRICPNLPGNNLRSIRPPDTPRSRATIHGSPTYQAPLKVRGFSQAVSISAQSAPASRPHSPPST